MAYGYGHIVIFSTIVATGAGLHVAAYYLGHHSKLDSAQTVLTVAVPLALYIIGIFVLYVHLVRKLEAVHVVVVVVLVAGVLAAGFCWHPRA